MLVSTGLKGNKKWGQALIFYIINWFFSNRRDLPMRPNTLATLLHHEFVSVEHGHHTPAMIWGPPGVGKSQIVAQVARNAGVPMIDIRLSQMEPSDLRGIPFRTGDHVVWAVPAMLPDAARQGPKGILFLDEINAAPPTVSAAAYQLVLDRRLGEYQVPRGWAIFAAGNRQGDRGVTYTMPAPLANRFSHYELEVNLNDWAVWAYRSGVDERLIAFLRFRPELLFDYDPSRDPMAFPTPRSWEFTHRCLRKFSHSSPLMAEAVQACVGAAAAVELRAFLDNLENLPDIDAIIQGESIDMPREVDLQYAVASALTARALAVAGAENAQTVFGHILNYAGRFPQREMGVMLVHDMAKIVGEEIYTVPQFAVWAKEVGHILL